MATEEPNRRIQLHVDPRPGFAPTLYILVDGKLVGGVASVAYTNDGKDQKLKVRFASNMRREHGCTLFARIDELRVMGIDAGWDDDNTP